MQSAPQIIVISGLPGAGKSTTARGLARRFDRAAHVEADKLHDLIVTGAVLPSAEGISEAAQRQLDLRLTNACLVAKSFVQAEFVAIIDDIVLQRGLDLIVEQLHGIHFEFVTLLPQFATVQQRWIDAKSPFADKWEWIDHEIRHNTSRVGHWLDTTDLDENDTIDAVAAAVGWHDAVRTKDM